MSSRRFILKMFAILATILMLSERSTGCGTNNNPMPLNGTYIYENYEGPIQDFIHPEFGESSFHLLCFDLENTELQWFKGSTQLVNGDDYAIQRTIRSCRRVTPNIEYIEYDLEIIDVAVEDEGVYTCRSADGLREDHFEVKVQSYCHHWRCENNGTCIPVTNTEYRCSCPDGYSGKNCEKLVDPCPTSPCGSHGQCEKNEADSRGYTCNCEDGYVFDKVTCVKGLRCLQDKLKPLIAPLPDYGLTASANSSYFPLHNAKLNYCGPDSGSDGNAWSALIYGGWIQANFGEECTGESEKFVDEIQIQKGCQTAPHVGDKAYTESFRLIFMNWNSTGAYVAESVDSKMYYTNFTLESPGGENASVIQYVNARAMRACQVRLHTRDYTWQRPILRWELYGCELDELDECSIDPCKNSATCVDLVHDYECICARPYYGKDCEEFDNCWSNPCQHRSRCEDLEDDFFCICEGTGYEGATCQKEVNECDSNPCQHHGTCTDLLADYECNCTNTGFEGKSCEINIEDCEKDSCMHGGQCVDLIKGYACNCNNTGFQGLQCETEVPSPCRDIPMCLRYCPYGFKLNEDGCRICECDSLSEDHYQPQLVFRGGVFARAGNISHGRRFAQWLEESCENVTHGLCDSSILWLPDLRNTSHWEFLVLADSLLWMYERAHVAPWFQPSLLQLEVALDLVLQNEENEVLLDKVPHKEINILPAYVQNAFVGEVIIQNSEHILPDAYADFPEEFWTNVQNQTDIYKYEKYALRRKLAEALNRLYRELWHEVLEGFNEIGDEHWVELAHNLQEWRINMTIAKMSACMRKDKDSNGHGDDTFDKFQKEFHDMMNELENNEDFGREAWDLIWMLRIIAEDEAMKWREHRWVFSTLHDDQKQDEKSEDDEQKDDEQEYPVIDFDDVYHGEGYRKVGAFWEDPKKNVTELLKDNLLKYFYDSKEICHTSMMWTSITLRPLFSETEIGTDVKNSWENFVSLQQEEMKKVAKLAVSQIEKASDLEEILEAQDDVTSAWSDFRSKFSSSAVKLLHSLPEEAETFAENARKIIAENELQLDELNDKYEFVHEYIMLNEHEDGEWEFHPELHSWEFGHHFGEKFYGDYRKFTKEMHSDVLEDYKQKLDMSHHNDHWSTENGCPKKTLEDLLQWRKKRSFEIKLKYKLWFDAIMEELEAYGDEGKVLKKDLEKAEADSASKLLELELAHERALAEASSHDEKTEVANFFKEQMENHKIDCLERQFALAERLRGISEDGWVLEEEMFGLHEMNFFRWLEFAEEFTDKLDLGFNDTENCGKESPEDVKDDFKDSQIELENFEEELQKAILATVVKYAKYSIIDEKLRDTYNQTWQDYHARIINASHGLNEKLFYVDGMHNFTELIKKRSEVEQLRQQADDALEELLANAGFGGFLLGNALKQLKHQHMKRLGVINWKLQEKIKEKQSELAFETNTSDPTSFIKLDGIESSDKILPTLHHSFEMAIVQFFSRAMHDFAEEVNRFKKYKMLKPHIIAELRWHGIRWMEGVKNIDKKISSLLFSEDDFHYYREVNESNFEHKDLRRKRDSESAYFGSDVKEEHIPGDMYVPGDMFVPGNQYRFMMIYSKYWVLAEKLGYYYEELGDEFGNIMHLFNVYNSFRGELQMEKWDHMFEEYFNKLLYIKKRWHIEAMKKRFWDDLMAWHKARQSALENAAMQLDYFEALKPNASIDFNKVIFDMQNAMNALIETYGFDAEDWHMGATVERRKRDAEDENVKASEERNDYSSIMNSVMQAAASARKDLEKHLQTIDDEDLALAIGDIYDVVLGKFHVKLMNLLSEYEKYFEHFVHKAEEPARKSDDNDWKEKQLASAADKFFLALDTAAEKYGSWFQNVDAEHREEGFQHFIHFWLGDLQGQRDNYDSNKWHIKREDIHRKLQNGMNLIYGQMFKDALHHEVDKEEIDHELAGLKVLGPPMYSNVTVYIYYSMGEEEEEAEWESWMGDPNSNQFKYHALGIENLMTSACRMSSFGRCMVTRIEFTIFLMYPIAQVSMIAGSELDLERFMDMAEYMKNFVWRGGPELIDVKYHLTRRLPDELMWTWDSPVSVRPSAELAMFERDQESTYGNHINLREISGSLMLEEINQEMFDWFNEVLLRELKQIFYRLVKEACFPSTRGFCDLERLNLFEMGEKIMVEFSVIGRHDLSWRIFKKVFEEKVQKSPLGYSGLTVKSRQICGMPKRQLFHGMFVIYNEWEDENLAEKFNQNSTKLRKILMDWVEESCRLMSSGKCQMKKSRVQRAEDGESFYYEFKLMTGSLVNRDILTVGLWHMAEKMSIKFKILETVEGQVITEEASVPQEKKIKGKAKLHILNKKFIRWQDKLADRESEEYENLKANLEDLLMATCKQLTSGRCTLDQVEFTEGAANTVIANFALITEEDVADEDILGVLAYIAEEMKVVFNMEEIEATYHELVPEPEYPVWPYKGILGLWPYVTYPKTYKIDRDCLLDNKCNWPHGTCVSLKTAGGFKIVTRCKCESPYTGRFCMDTIDEP